MAEALALGCGQRFRYLYYLDVVSNLADSGMQNAMRHLQACPALVRWFLLGNPLACMLLCRPNPVCWPAVKVNFPASGMY